MATITPSPENGRNLISKLAQGTYIDQFDYDEFEKPDTAKSLIMPFGNDILGFQQLAGYIDEDDMASDELAWFESGRLIKSYKLTDATPVVKAGTTLTFPAGHDIRKEDSIEIFNATNKVEAVVSAVAGNDVTVLYRAVTPPVADGNVGVIHKATEFKKGTGVQEEWLTRDGDRKTNKPIILKDSIRYTRSDLAQLVQFADGDDTLWSIDTSDMEARFQNQQVMAGIFGYSSEATSGADAGDLKGMESYWESATTRGNTHAGSIDDLDDIQALTRLLKANKSPKDFLLLQDLDYHQKLTKALGGINRHDANSYNFGNFANVGDKMMDLNFRGFDSDGYMFAYKNWDVLDDEMYYGAFDTSTAKPKGMLIPAGETPDAKGEIIPYFSYVYRRGGRRVVGKDGQVFGIGTGDYAELGYTTEFTVRGASMKDVTAFKSA